MEHLEGGVGEGERVQALSRLVGRYAAQGLSHDQAIARARQWNLRNTPPLAEEELAGQVESMWRNFNARDVTQDEALALVNRARELDEGPGRRDLIISGLQGFQGRRMAIPVRFALRESLHDLGLPKGTFDALLPLPRRTGEGADAADPASLLVAMAREQAAELFLDSQQREPWIVYYNEGGLKEWWPVRSTPAEQWLRAIYYEQHQKVVRSEALASVAETLAAIAARDGSVRSLTARCSSEDGSYWYDLGVGNGKAVSVGATGWSIVSDPPVLFRRLLLHHSVPDPIPSDPEELDGIFDIINVSSKVDRLLLKVYLVTALATDIARPILVFHGSEGSGKSWAQQAIVRVLNPRSSPLQRPPDDTEDLHIAAQDMTVFVDNLRNLSPWMSDSFCRLCTGEGDVRRRLYTDADQYALEVRCLVGFNGIHEVASYPDLVSRCLSIHFTPPAGGWLLQRSLEHLLDERRPHLLGALFEALSRALSLLDQRRRDGTLPVRFNSRLADWYMLGSAVAAVLGEERAFDGALRARAVERAVETTEASPVTSHLFQLLESSGNQWAGTPTELHHALTTLQAEESGTRREPTGWPRSAWALMRSLHTYKIALERQGLTFEESRTNRQKSVALRLSSPS